MTTVAPAAEEIEAVCRAALIAYGAHDDNARPVAGAIARAEEVGNRVCGLFYLPIFCRHLEIGKVDGTAMPRVAAQGASVIVDAACGFAHPAIEAGMPDLLRVARGQGIAAMAVRNSYNCLALADHVAPIAEEGLIGICLSNAPASVAPPGATRPLFGTNPLAFAVPCADGRPIVVDQSMSAVTKTEMILRRCRGEPIPPGWAQDRAGLPTTDAATGLEGSLLAAGGRKGANVALLVEVLAAALTGSSLSAHASGFGDEAGGPPRVGQFLLAIDPGHFAGAGFAAGITGLLDLHGEAGTRLPGRAARRSDIAVDGALWDRVLALAGGRG